MTDETDPFGDLDESLGDDSADSVIPDEAGGDGDRRELGEKGDVMESETVDARNAPAGREDSLSRPAFPFDETKQDALYARKEAWQQFEDTLDFEVKRILRERGHENIEGRELHDAALRVVADHAEEIADEVKEQRNQH